MKTDRQAKTEPGSEKSKVAKKPRSSRKKSSGSNGNIPLPTYEHAPIGIVECSPDGKHISANEEFCRFLGYEKAELLGKSLKEITHEDDYALDMKLHQQLVEGRIPFYRLEERYLHKNGGSIWAELTRSIIRDVAGNPLYTLGVVLDISDRKQVERVLRESTERLRLATEAARMFTWELDLKTRIYTFADHFEHVLGFSAGLLPKNSVEVVEALSPKEDVQAFWDAVTQAIASHRDLQSQQLRVIDPDTGHTVWLEENAKIVYDEEGNAQRMFGVAQNITENKKAQQEILIVSRMPEENPNPVMRLTPDGNVLYANPRSASLLKSWKRDGTRALPDQLKAGVAKAFASSTKQEVEIEQDGKVFSATLAPIPEAGYVNFYGSDVTQRRRAERSLRESEERFRGLVNQATAGITQTNLHGRLTFANQTITEMLGYHKLELIGKTIQELTYPGDWEQLQSLFEELVETGKPFEVEQCLLHKNGSTIWVSLSMSPLRDANANMYSTIAVIVDITERKRIEQALKEFARQQEALYQFTDELQHTNSLEDVFKAGLDAILSGLQCDRASILLYDNTYVMRFVAWRGLSDEYRKATDGHSPWQPEAEHPEPICMDDVSTADLSDSLRAVIQNEGIGALAFIPLVVNGKLIGKFMTYYDAPHSFNEEEVELGLTIARQLAFGIDRRRAQEALVRERELLERLFERMPVMVSMYDAETQSLRLNEEFERVLGWRSEEVSVLSLLEGLYPDPDYRTQVIQSMAAADRNDWVEARVQTRDGRTLDTLWANVSIRKGEQLITGIGLGIDITERKRAEEKVRESEERYRTIVDTANEGIWYIDLHANSLYLNEPMAQILGYSVDEVLGHQVPEFCFAEDLSKVQERIGSNYAGNYEHFDFRFRRKDGSEVLVLASTSPVRNAAGEITGAMGMFVDITERKRAEERIQLLNNDLQAQLDEMNTLLDILPTGVWIGNQDCSIITGNAAAYQMLGLTLGINASLTNPEPQLPAGLRLFVEGREVEPENAPMQQVARTGKPLHNFEHEILFEDGTLKSVHASIVPLFDPNGAVRKVIGSYTDFTERKQAENRLVLLAEVSELLRTIEDPNELLYAVSTAVGEHLSVKRCLFNEIDLDHDLEIVHRDYVNEVESVAGVHKISDYSSVTSAEMEAGKTVVNYDSKTDPRTAPDYERSYVAYGERSYVTVPLMRENRWVASLWVSDDQPRQWSQEEVSLLEAVAERTWTVVEKLRIAEDLRSKEAELEAIITETPFMLTRCTRDLRYRFVSRAYAEMIGRTPEEIAGKPIVEIMGEEGLKTITPYIEKVLRGQRVEYESEVPFEGSGTPFLHVVYTPDRAEDGNVIGWFASIVDISERKRAEAALQASEQRFREIFETAGVSVWLEDFMQVKMAINALRAQGVDDFRMYFAQHPDFVRRAVDLVRVVDVNNETLDLFGARDKKDLLGSLSHVFAPETEQIFVEELTALAEGRETLRAETQVRTLAGKPISVLFTVHFAPQTGDQSHVVVTLTDITERKRMEEALRIENERFMRFVDSNIVGILIGDPSGRVILANDYYLNLLGVNRQDFAEGKVDWKKFTPPEWLPADEKAIRELHERGVCEPYEKEYLRADGRRVPVYITNAMLPGPGEEIAAFVLDITERKRAEEALRRNEQMLATMIEAAPFGVYFIDSQFRLQAINKGSEAVFSGIDPLLGRDFAEILRIIWKEPFATEAIERFRHTLRTGASFISPTIIEERANIEEIQAYDWQIHRIILPDGTYGVVCYFYDLSEQKRMEAAVRASESLYRTIARSIPGGGVYVVDKDMRYIVADGAVTEAFGLAREVLEGRTVSEVFPDERGIRMVERLQRTFAGETVSFETEHKGRVYWTQQAPLSGSIGQAIIVTLDITERKRAEEALRESEERFRAILRQATAGIVRKDVDGRLLFVNQAYCNMLGYTEAELIGKPFWEFIHEDDMQENNRLYKRLMQEGVPFKLEKRLLRSDGSILWADVSVSPIMDAAGKPQSAVAVEVDITARKQAEEALQLLNLQLETRVVERTAELQAMNKSLQDEIKERRQVELALDESRRRLQILTQRLVEVQEEERRAIARELHDRVGQTLSALNINLIIMRSQILPDSLERVGPRFDDSMQLVGETITLVRDVMSNLRPAVLDDYGLEAALQSHMDEYMSRYEIKVIFDRSAQPIPRLGPSIEMTFLRIAQEALMNIARHAHATQVTLSLWQDGDSVCMAIQDNGSGIVSWQQANRPGSHGLTIMRERAEAFGGNFKVGSVPGQGTKIEMSIPVGKGSPAEAQKEILE